MKDGLFVQFDGVTPDVFHNQSQQPQKVGSVQPNLYRTFKAEGNKGFVVVKNELVSVKVFPNGEVIVSPHEQLLEGSQ